MPMGIGIGLSITLGEGGSLNLEAYLATLADSAYFDFTKTDRHFQDSSGLLADDVGEAIGFSLDQAGWAKRTFAEQMALETNLAASWGDFSSATGWTLTTGWAISGGVLTKTTGDTGDASRTESGIVVGATYEGGYSLDTAQGINVRNGAQYIVSGPAAAGVRKAYFSATAQTFGFQSGSFNFNIDNATLKRVTGKSAIQGTSGARPLRQTSGAKFDGSDDNELTTYSAGAGSNFIVAAVSVPATLAAAQVIAGASGVGVNRFQLAIDASGRACAGIGGDTVSTIVGTSDLRGRDVVVGVSIDGSTVRLFADAVQEYAAAQNSTPTTSVPVRLGANNNNGTASSFFAGAIKRIVTGRDALTLSRYLQIRNVLAAA